MLSFVVVARIVPCRAGVPYYEQNICMAFFACTTLMPF